MQLPITSLQNQRIKDVVKLDKRNERDSRRVTVVEGIREVSRALTAGVVPVEMYVCPELMEAETSGSVDQWISKAVGSDQSAIRNSQFAILPVSRQVFAKIAYRGDSGGVLMVIPYFDTRLACLPIKKNPFFAVIEGVEKPGNLGAILRTADAAGVDGVIVAASATDLHNPNVVRASLGTLFTVPVAEVPLPETVTFLRSHGIQIIAADPDATTRYTAVDLTRPTAFVMGSEAFGLSPEMRAAADHRVSIPMHGIADSLNLATATALLLYEVVRQRM